MPIECHLSNDEVWLYYTNTERDESPFNIFKLHINIGPNDLDLIRDKIERLLLRALADGIIPQYKIVHFGNTLQKAFKENWDFQSIDRHLHLPYTIFLYDDVALNDFPRLQKLCLDLEAVLNNLPTSDPSHFCVSDVNFLPHLYFRVSYLGDKYIFAFDPGVEECRKLALASAHYWHLNNIVVDLKEIPYKKYDSESLDNGIRIMSSNASSDSIKLHAKEIVQFNLAYANEKKLEKEKRDTQIASNAALVSPPVGIFVGSKKTEKLSEPKGVIEPPKKGNN